MLSQRLANIVFAALILAGCVYFALVAQGFETSGLLASSGLPSKFFPQLMLGGMAIFALVVAHTYITKGGAGGDDASTVFAGSGEARRGLLMLAVCIASYAIWRNFGFIPMAILLGPLSLLAMGVRAPIIYAVVWALTALVYVVFTYGLGIGLV